MKKRAHILSALAAGVLAVATPTAALAAPKPTPAQVKTYLCTIHHGTDDGCASIPGVWNDWAGRPTPPRWDPCSSDGRTTLFHLAPCGPMTPTIRQWCTLNFDHSPYGSSCTGQRRR